MHNESIEPWVHDHIFGQDRKNSGERRAIMVIVITALTMVVEIAAGISFGSMALLADGLHMASHSSALTISAFAYYYTRRHAKDSRFNFGTGKVNSLAAFASAVMLVLFSLVMAWESIQRFIFPVAIEFNQAIFVAVLGLIVNGMSVLLLRGQDPSHAYEPHDHDGNAGGRHHDHNLWSAYLHVLADALTSLLAIAALLAGKYLGQGWLDPLMGVVGAVLVVSWSRGLLRASARVLLDLQAPEELRNAIRKAIEDNGDHRVSDLHVWSVGPGIYAAEIAVVSSDPLSVDGYYGLLPKTLGLVHVTVEPHRCVHSSCHAA
jgi:cation diffusion facilitator family transporter